MNNVTIINCALFHNEIKSKNVIEMPLFANYSFGALRMGLLCRYFKLPFGTNINKNISQIEDDTIIVFDAGIKKYDRILDIVARINKGKRLIFYYWNPVKNSIEPKYIPDKYEKWTYSYSDSLKYQLIYNSTFYCSELSKVGNTGMASKWDILFVGRNKGRKGQLKYWKNVFENKGLSVYLYITATHPKVQKWKYQEEISYIQNLELIAMSKCIFDLYRDKTAGLSLRVMESLFMERKLITNNITIADYDFYDNNNIFILGKDDINQLYNFINTPYKKIDFQIKKKYEFESWIERF